MSANPALIAIEGIDRSGKSTVSRMLVEILRERGHEVASYDFPDYEAPQFGPLVARFLRGGFGSLGEAEPWFVGMLFAGNRAELAPRIRSDLAAGRIVVCDRYSYSNVAFQTAKVEDLEERARLARWLERLELDTFGIPRADASFWLRVPLALRPGSDGDRGDRGYLDGRADVHESDEQLQLRVHEAYEALANSHLDVETIDCVEHGELLAPSQIAAALARRVEALSARERSTVA